MADHVFICYARSDQEFVLQLAKNLKDKGVPIWLDQWDVPAGADWDKTIDAALYSCGQMLIILSPTSVDSREVRGELQVALDEDKPIIPVLFKKCPIPRQLRVVQHVDFTSIQPDDRDALSIILSVLNVQKAEEESKRKVAEEEAERIRIAEAERKSEAERKQKEEEKREEISKTYTNTIGMKFFVIPAGSFTMGTDQDYENPPHKVKISQSFYLQTTQVTQRQWKKVMEDNPSDFKDCGDDCPVETVSWDDAQKYIKKLNKIEKTDKYRLPTEAEWEYACRAGTATEFFFGDDAEKLGEYAWYSGNSEGVTHPISTKKPNPWGLYDMHGNVDEWVEDDWHDDYEGAPTDGRAWIDEPRGASRVIRGGSWEDGARYCRSAIRGRDGPGDRYYDVGFRLARSVALDS